MIRKAVIVVCLLFTLTALVVGVFSYRREIVCLGTEQGITGRPGLPPIFSTQNDVIRLTTASRTSFMKGVFLHFWTTKPPGQMTSVNRTINGIVFRWRQNSAVFFRSGSNDIYICVLKGILVNQLDIPLWGPLILFLVYPTHAFISGPLLRHRRRKKGLCLKCGYNLTGNVSGVCPECGEKI